jgi:hypothetical protein
VPRRSKKKGIDSLPVLVPNVNAVAQYEITARGTMVQKKGCVVCVCVCVLTAQFEVPTSDLARVSSLQAQRSVVVAG